MRLCSNSINTPMNIPHCQQRHRSVHEMKTLSTVGYARTRREQVVCEEEQWVIWPQLVERAHAFPQNGHHRLVHVLLHRQHDLPRARARLHGRLRRQERRRGGRRTHRGAGHEHPRLAGCCRLAVRRRAGRHSHRLRGRGRRRCRDDACAK